MPASILVHRLGHFVGATDDAPFSVGARTDRSVVAWLGDQAPGWRRRAACRAHPEPDRFIPATETEPVPSWVAQLCGGCVVREQCLAVAVASRAEGYWAGLTTGQRRRLG
jgi:hypothetical protein